MDFKMRGGRNTMKENKRKVRGKGKEKKLEECKRKRLEEIEERGSDSKREEE
jgi:hypothetical protein